MVGMALVTDRRPWDFLASGCPANPCVSSNSTIGNPEVMRVDLLICGWRVGVPHEVYVYERALLSSNVSVAQFKS
jgi:hypothetical protein